TIEPVRELAATRPTWAVATGWIHANCLLALGRIDEAAAMLAEAAAVHWLKSLSSHQSALHLLDAEIALERQDVARARRAFRRAHETPDALLAYDFELRSKVIALRIAQRENRPLEAA